MTFACVAHHLEADDSRLFFFGHELALDNKNKTGNQSNGLTVNIKQKHLQQPQISGCINTFRNVSIATFYFVLSFIHLTQLWLVR